MKNYKTNQIIYWTATILFSLFFIADGTMGIIGIEEGKEIISHLGYPMYFLTILGVAKLTGALAILLPGSRVLKEWAYAGFTFHFLGACASRAFVGDSLILVLSPLMFLGFMMISYFLRKRLEHAKQSPSPSLAI